MSTYCARHNRSGSTNTGKCVICDSENEIENLRAKIARLSDRIAGLEKYKARFEWMFLDENWVEWQGSDYAAGTFGEGPVHIADTPEEAIDKVMGEEKP